MVLRRCDPSAAVRLLHSPDWNWLPLSVVMEVGVPNLAIQPCKKVRAMVSARISEWKGFRPTSEPVDHCENIPVAIRNGQRSNQVQMNGVKAVQRGNEELKCAY